MRMRSNERPRFIRHFYLIHLLIILPHRTVVIHLRRQRIISYSFQLIGPLRVSGNFQHLFKRKHHLYSRTQFRTLRRIAEADQLIACPNTGRKPNGIAYHLRCLLHGVDALAVIITLIIDNRFFKALSQVYSMQAVLCHQLSSFEKNIRPVQCLLVYQIA